MDINCILSVSGKIFYPTWNVPEFLKESIGTKSPSKGETETWKQSKGKSINLADTTFSIRRSKAGYCAIYIKKDAANIQRASRYKMVIVGGLMKFKFCGKELHNQFGISWSVWYKYSDLPRALGTKVSTFFLHMQSEDRHCISFLQVTLCKQSTHKAVPAHQLTSSHASQVP